MKALDVSSSLCTLINILSDRLDSGGFQNLQDCLRPRVVETEKNLYVLAN